jgi:preprotein translocase subunit YajC
MIVGLEPQVFFSFLSWPITYIVIAIIMFLVMGRNDKKEEQWEQDFEKWQASLPEGERIAQSVFEKTGGDVK